MNVLNKLISVVRNHGPIRTDKSIVSEIIGNIKSLNHCFPAIGCFIYRIFMFIILEYGIIKQSPGISLNPGPSSLVLEYLDALVK